MNGFSPHLPRLYRQFLHFQTQGCYLEKLLRNKDIPPGKRGFHVFETPLTSISSLQVGPGTAKGVKDG